MAWGLKAIAYITAALVVIQPGVDRKSMLDSVLSTFSHVLHTEDQRIIFTVINVVGHQTVFWSANLMMYVIYKLQWPFFEQFKVQKDVRFPGALLS